MHKLTMKDEPPVAYRFLDSYFRPGEFERWKNGRIYEYWGVRLFKKYLPTSGDIVSKWWGSRRIEVRNKSRSENLWNHYNFTRRYEVRHIFGGVSMQALSIFSVLYWNKGNLLVLTLANILINVYPILLQRYNRVRVLRVLKRFQGYAALESESSLLRAAGL